VSDADFTQRPFEDLRQYFLGPIAASKEARLVKTIHIDARSAECDAWTCRVELDGGLGVISLEHIGAFFRSEEPHGFESSARYVLGELKKLDRRMSFQ
jgi:hypothetical protein